MKTIDQYYRGYINAVAEILKTHGDVVVAKDVLRCVGKDALKHADAEDLATLKEHGLTGP